MSINPIIIMQNFKIGELDAESDTLSWKTVLLIVVIFLNY